MINLPVCAHACMGGWVNRVRVFGEKHSIYKIRIEEED